jgi:hypothetical protein
MVRIRIPGPTYIIRGFNLITKILSLLLPDFAVVRDETTGEFLYADLDSDGELKTTSFRVDKADPAKEGLTKVLRNVNGRKGSKSDESRMLADGTLDDHHRRAIQTTGTIKNLVIPLKWKDHKRRTLPSKNDIDVLMNHAGPEERCPTGSVKDVFLENSYGKLELESTVVDWILMPNTEAFYADSRSG